MATHIKILNKSEIEAFESVPNFSASERKKYFYISDWIQSNIADFENDANKICFVLMFGYFRASKNFPLIKYFSQKDIEYVTNKLCLDSEDKELKNIERWRISRYKKVILEYFGYSAFYSKTKALLIAEANNLVQKQIKPKSLFILLIQFLLQKRIEIPRFNTVSEIITNAFNDFEKTLIENINNNLNSEQKSLLDSLLDFKENEGNKNYKRYNITLLKRISQSTRASKVKENLKDLATIQEIFESVKGIYTKVDLSPISIQYYANWAKKAKIFHIKSKSEKKRYLYFLSFILYQYYILQDVLVDTLLSAVQNSKNGALRQQKERFFEKKDFLKNTISETSDYIKNEISITYNTIENKLKDNHLSYQARVEEALNLIKQKKETNYNIKKKLDELELESEKTMKQDEYSILESQSIALQRKVSPIVKVLSFQKDSSNKVLMDAINYFVQHDGVIGNHAPTDFMEFEKQRAIVDKKGKIKVSLYKLFLFFEIANAIKAGDLNLIHSYKYKPFDDYLISKEEWKQNKKSFIEKAELTIFQDCNTVLNILKKNLDEQFETTNANIINGFNEYIRFPKKGGFHVETSRVEKEESNIVSDLFPQSRYVSLLEILSSINKYTGFADSFEHYNLKYNREKPKDKVFFAGVMGYGCNIGIKRMAKISRGISENTLDNTINWYFSVDNLLSSNNKVLKFMSELELSKVFLKNKKQNHTASDGKKRGVAVDSLHSNYSYKYFGSGKGVSVYTFIDERHLLFHSTVISSGLRESAYVIDGLLHNDIVQSTLHSTDTHGYTEAIFGTTHLLGFSFAPRIKKFSDQQLYSFLPRKEYEARGHKILPDSKIDVKLIEENWDDFLRLIATLKLNYTTAHQLFKRLNSYSRQHPLYKTMKEFGKIIKTIFLLKYIDDLELRQAIEKQLNKVENSNKFSDAIFFANNQEFQVESQEEQEIIEHCKQLIENSIICWNYLHLSKIIARTEQKDEKQRLIEAIGSGSIVFWKHINVFGEYDFTERNFKNFDESSFPKNLGINIE
jgi:TnpA family transposase